MHNSTSKSFEVPKVHFQHTNLNNHSIGHLGVQKRNIVFVSRTKLKRCICCKYSLVNLIQQILFAPMQNVSQVKFGLYISSIDTVHLLYTLPNFIHAMFRF